MRRCIQLAKNGLGTTYPNPLVGSVIVYENKIIGEGWHRQSGMPHAEVNAINSVKNKQLLRNATIYINLELANAIGIGLNNRFVIVLNFLSKHHLRLLY